MKTDGRSWRTVLLAVTMVAVALGATLPVCAQRELAARRIIVFKPGVNEASQNLALRDFDATALKPLPLINAWVVRATRTAAEDIADDLSVLRVDRDLLVEAFQPLGDSYPVHGRQPEQTLPWGIERVGAPEVWATTTGARVRVGIVDTGIDLDHPDLSANIAGNVGLITGITSGDDDNGHGTHVAGTVAAIANDIGVVGVAPRAKLYAVKVLSRTGRGFMSDVIDGLGWCVNNDLHVVNMSLGCAEGNESFHDAVRAVHDAGIVIVAAAGNDGEGRVSYPAAYDDEVIAVSATNPNDDLARVSNYGWEIDFAAPGVGINSTYFRSGYAVRTGTSVASAHVAGACALRLAAHRGESPAEVEAALAAAAEDLGAAGHDPNFGNGLIKAQGAL